MKPRKVSQHVNQNEGLIFEKSSPGKKAYKLPPLDVPDVNPEELLGEQAREDLGLMPEVSEIEIIRHFTRLSTWNYAIDLGMYPLGSCTMKYNARVNEFVARLEGLGNAHPYQPEKISQGALRIINTLQECLCEIINLKSNAEGMVDASLLASVVDESVAGMMLTNPSTIGVFEQEIHRIADVLHDKGALLYMDGANMNALVGKTRPGDFGVDVMHLNLHK